MKRDNDNLPSDKGLDEAIRASLLSQTDESRLRRLERFWHLQSQRQARQRQVLVTLPFATAAAAAVVFCVILWSRQEDTKSAPPRNKSPNANSDLADTGNTDRTPIDQSQLGGRPPTGYERFVFAVRTSALVPATTMSATIDEAINQLRQNPESNANQIVNSPGFERRVRGSPITAKIAPLHERGSTRHITTVSRLWHVAFNPGDSGA